MHSFASGYAESTHATSRPSSESACSKLLVGHERLILPDSPVSMSSQKRERVLSWLQSKTPTKAPPPPSGIDGFVLPLTEQRLAHHVEVTRARATTPMFRS